jgi:oligosaccharyltransferase complex subunit delta (ribophorin II)
MRLAGLALVLVAPLVHAAAAAWGFDGASVAVAGKNTDAGAQKQVFSQAAPLEAPLVLAPAETLRVHLTTTEGKKAKRPHQAFLLLTEPESGLEAPFPLKVSSSGAATVDITHKDLPTQLLLAASPLRASIVVGSFGAAKPLLAPVFAVDVRRDRAVNVDYKQPLRYGKLPEIHHEFRADPQNPPKVVSLVFAGAVLATLPALFIAWFALGANAKHLLPALSAAPLSHATFFSSIVALEGAFVLYYFKWNLFQTLPLIGGLSVVALLGGMRALGEVQSRRLAGER